MKGSHFGGGFLLVIIIITHLCPMANIICFFTKIVLSYGKGVIPLRYIGCHLSTTGGFVNTVKTANSIGANTFAFFTRNPRGSQAKPLDVADCEKAMELLAEKKFLLNWLDGKVILSHIYVIIPQPDQTHRIHHLHQS